MMKLYKTVKKGSTRNLPSLPSLFGGIRNDKFNPVYSFHAFSESPLMFSSVPEM